MLQILESTELIEDIIDLHIEFSCECVCYSSYVFVSHKWTRNTCN